MLNHITIMGRLTRDPELRRTSSGIAVASFTVAVDRDFGGRDSGEKETDFIDCVAWRQTGEFVSKYFSKGSMIVVSGRLQIRNWNDKDGNKRRNAEVVADNVYFGESKRSSDSNSAYGGNSSYGNSNNYGGGSYGNNSNYGGYNNAPAPAPSYGGYTAPASAPASDFAMLEDDDAQLPF
ncbi:MAG: single-stranded DNA-binding protein [Firmicutes bacterium]|nr:single-stranded DNA-binding protein [Bacillota bacterium]